VEEERLPVEFRPDQTSFLRSGIDRSPSGWAEVATRGRGRLADPAIRTMV